jgi:hypothetical protein
MLGYQNGRFELVFTRLVALLGILETRKYRDVLEAMRFYLGKDSIHGFTW